jgi:hypothetical protein
MIAGLANEFNWAADQRLRAMPRMSRPRASKAWLGGQAIRALRIGQIGTKKILARLARFREAPLFDRQIVVRLKPRTWNTTYRR